jgi:hypothetical protein
MNTNTLVQKLWNYCNVLRDDGMSYGDYVEQLTYLLFLKMADERLHQVFVVALALPVHAPRVLARLRLHARELVEDGVESMSWRAALSGRGR